jgi:hypothetical protein
VTKHKAGCDKRFALLRHRDVQVEAQIAALLEPEGVEVCG